MPATATTTVPLSVPVDLRTAEGDGQVVSLLVLRRPKTKHVKKLVALAGPDFVTAVFGDGSVQVKPEQVVGALAGLVTADRLDGLTEIVADLCGVEAAVIDELDPDDLPAVVGALAGFFPALRSLGSSSS